MQAKNEIISQKEKNNANQAKTPAKRNTNFC